MCAVRLSFIQLQTLFGPDQLGGILYILYIYVPMFEITEVIA